MFIDDALGFAALHFLQSKADAITALKDLVAWAESQIGFHLHSIRSDQGGEYINQSLKMFLVSRGIESIRPLYLIPHSKTVMLNASTRLSLRSQKLCVNMHAYHHLSGKML